MTDLDTTHDPVDDDAAPAASGLASAADHPAALRHGPPPAAAAANDPLARLPTYARSLLKIEVPLSVRLASKKQPVGQIVELCPGSIIAFDKTCDEMLELCAGGYTLAIGEAVKVGDKFGLRISSMRMPDERFHNVVRSDLGSDRTAARAASTAPLPASSQRP